MCKMTNKTFTSGFLLSDQVFIELDKENVSKFFRDDENGIRHEVSLQGKPICSTKAIFPKLTFHNQLNSLYFKDSFESKKIVLLPILQELVNTLYTKTLNKKTLKKELTFDFRFLILMLLGDIPPIDVLKEDVEEYRDILQTIFFEIDVSFFRNEPQQKTKYFFKRTDYFFSYLQIQYILEGIYPNEDLNVILDMRSQVINSLKILGFAATIHQRRVLRSELPEQFYTKLISSGQYTSQHNSIFSYGFCGIRLIRKL